VRVPDGKSAAPSPRRVTPPGATPPKLTPEELHERRVAWGKDAGAKVAAAYKERMEAE